MLYEDLEKVFEGLAYPLYEKVGKRYHPISKNTKIVLQSRLSKLEKELRFAQPNF